MTTRKRPRRPEPPIAQPEPLPPPGQEPIEQVHPFFENHPLAKIAQMQVFHAEYAPFRLKHLRTYRADKEGLHTINEDRIGRDFGSGDYRICARGKGGQLIGWKILNNLRYDRQPDLVRSHIPLDVRYARIELVVSIVEFACQIAKANLALRAVAGTLREELNATRERLEQLASTVSSIRSPPMNMPSVWGKGRLGGLN